MPFVNLTLLYFPKTQCSQNFSLLILWPLKSLLLLYSIISFSFICPRRRICQSLVTLPSDNERVATTASLVTVDPYKTYNLIDLFFPFITTRTHLLTFRIPHSLMYLYLFESRVLNKIRFLFRSGMCLTLPSFLTNPSNILIMTIPIPVILQDILFPINTTPLNVVSYVENQSRLGHIWNMQPESRI